ncbi:unnamed protein product [Candida verbasci]|uniref:PAN2-PAN3 deadenylation complex catalytic subunit PAN2 n=1 Tax=Candida verbasci TaxID=1227364 RepID=A0A9W4TUR2_9ASCO|nr:unnamed protein product [Candida verbasci]
MDGWNEITRVAVSPSDNNNKNYDSVITSLLFDSVQSLVWISDSNGYTKSYLNNQSTAPYQFELYPYTKFNNSDSNPFSQSNSVRKILSHKQGILSLQMNQLNFTSRRGLPIANFNKEVLKDEKFKKLNSMTFNTMNSANELIVSNENTLFNIDLNKSALSTLDYSSNDISILNSSSKFLTIGNNNGTLSLFDSNSNSIVKDFNTHNGYISDLDVRGNYIATCGYSIKPRKYNLNQQPEYMIDPLVNIYDIRNMKAIAPVPFPAGATSIRFHPKLSNIIIIASLTGQIQFVDIFDQSNVYLYQANLLNSQSQISPKMSNLEINENGDYILFNDSSSNIHLWSITNSGSISKSFVNFPESIEQPDIVENKDDTFIDIDDTIPLSIIGMPYYKELLLSNYPYELKYVKETANLPNQIDMDMIIQYNKHNKIMPFDSKKFSNYFNDEYRSLKESKDLQVPKFISEKNEDDGGENEELPDDSIFEFKSDESKVPKCYSRLQIQYSKFGVKDFDFSYYNKSNGQYCGLENHTDNSYINSLLQLYRFQPTLYNQITTTLNKEWLPTDFIESQPEGSSILNELAYLFDMMYKAKSNNVKIYNFTQVMNHNEEVKLLNLINVNELLNLNSQEVRGLIISFNNFLLNQLSKDFNSQFEESFNSTKLSYEIVVEGNGHLFDKRYGSMFSLELITPPNNMLNKMSVLVNSNQNNLGTVRKNINILTYLEFSMNQYKTIPCQQCQQFHNLEIKTSIIELPKVLVLNVNLNNEEFELINNFKKWLVPEFYAIKNNKNNNGYSFKAYPTNKEEAKYELLGYICEISHHADVLRNGTHSLVSYIKTENGWFLFNDFLVMPISEDEVYNLNLTWKKPVIILYQQEDQPKFKYFSDYSNFQGDDSILYRDHFAGPIRESYQKEYKLLTKSEAPKPGTLVAIDAEFVVLNPEELEISYNGDKKLIKPKQLSLARISVLRGCDGIAFIDDYIVHTSHIYDYLTNFSGIEQNDLNLNKSSKNLTTLQTTYRKLWLLLNLGVIFIGHGLYNDFRTINLQVPQEQIRDTLILYYKADFKRQLSLKFLAYILLQKKVQSGNHDSIEDANTALLLYKKYLKLTEAGTFENALDYIYSEGQQLRYRVPE